MRAASGLTLVRSTVARASTLALTAAVTRSASARLEVEIGAQLSEVAGHMAGALDRGPFERWRDVQLAASLDAVRGAPASPEAGGAVLAAALRRGEAARTTWPDDPEVYLAALEPTRGCRDDPGLGGSVVVRQRADRTLAAVDDLRWNVLLPGSLIALSTAAGRVAITGWTTPEGASRRLHRPWRERGGPPVSPPARTGFGSRLIERNLAAALQGQAAIRDEPDGVTCAITALVVGAEG